MFIRSSLPPLSFNFPSRFPLKREVSPVRYAWVVAGLADFFVNFRLDCINSPFYVHDCAAGTLLVQEAGGRSTTLRNLPLGFDNPPHMGEIFGYLHTA